MAADVHQFVPVMWNDHTPEPYRKSVHLDQDLADRAIEWITGHKSIKPDLPFMMLWASGSMHSPHHAPDSYIDNYRGQVRHGLGQSPRANSSRGQKELGYYPGEHRTDRSASTRFRPGIHCPTTREANSMRGRWRCSPRRWNGSIMQIGRVVAELERIGELDNTLIFVTADNGASGEGGLAGYVQRDLCAERTADTLSSEPASPRRLGPCGIPTRTTTRAGRWPATRRSVTSSRASTAAGNRIIWSCTGRTASRARRDP